MAGIDTARAAGAVGLSVVVALSLLIVIVAADRPSGLAPTSHANYFPDWMAGPLGGLWPGLTSNPTTLRYLFSAIVVAMFVGYLVLLRNVTHLSARWVVGAIVAVHAIFVLAPPMALTDVFNYINYGRMEVLYHLNPYTSIPIVEPHRDPAFLLSNWHQLLSPYGPLFTLLTFAVVPLGVAGSFWALKCLIALVSLATIALVWRCARLLGRDPVSAVAFVGLNPIVLVWGLGGDHNDFLMMFCIVLGFYLLLLGRVRARAAPKVLGGVRDWLLPLSWVEIGAGAAFVTAAAFKASGGILIPIVLAGMLRSRRGLAQMVIGMLAAGAALGLASLVAFGLHIPDLSTQSQVVAQESVPNLIGFAIGAGGETAALRTIMTLLLACSLLACMRAAYRHGDAIASSGWASVTLLVTLSWVLPWYVLWVLPLAALSSSRRLRTAVAVVGTYLIIVWVPAAGLVWQAIGFHPEKTPLGRLHQRYVRELLN
ncbi:MAG TPA: hypothetical protein VFW29_05215 [Solirubrobacteraceae bacterium]|nr:hypothetical protein [Solirubrobacteraceae bacterium]